MSARELSILFGMCLVWGFHFVVIKTAVGVLPPIFYAAIRMTLVAAIMAPFLRWRNGAMLRVFFAAMCLGALNYAFMFSGVKYATASAAAIAIELYVPFATILSFFFLGDKIGWRRILGIAFAFAGVAIIALGREENISPDVRIGVGVGLVAAGAFVEAIGAILVKQSAAFKPHELLAWFSLFGAVGLWLMTPLVENGQIAAFQAGDKLVIAGAIIYSAIGASVFGHSAYYWLLQRLPVSVVAPSVLLTTLLAVFFSVLILGEPLGLSMILGGLMTLAGVGVVLLRTARKQEISPAVNEPGAGS